MPDATDAQTGTTDRAAALAKIRTDLAHLKVVALAAAVPGNVMAFDFEVLMPRYARAVAAVEAALELHQPVDRGTGAQCKGCATHVTFTRWPCPTVEVITRELSGEGGGDGS